MQCGYGGGSTITKFDDFCVGIDKNDDGDFLDAGERMLLKDDFNSNQIGLDYDDDGSDGDRRRNPGDRRLFRDGTR